MIVIRNLIEQGVSRFLFGDHSQFNDLCYDTVTELKQEYPHIKRIKYRKDYQEISESVKQYFSVKNSDNVSNFTPFQSIVEKSPIICYTLTYKSMRNKGLQWSQKNGMESFCQQYCFSYIFLFFFSPSLPSMPEAR